jgi:hypothetical protein
MTMLPTTGKFSAALFLCLGAILLADPRSEVDEQLLAKGRVFPAVFFRISGRACAQSDMGQMENITFWLPLLSVSLSSIPRASSFG